MNIDIDDLRKNSEKENPSYSVGNLLPQICLPVEAMVFLAKETSFKNPSRFSKVEAFVDIVTRHLLARTDPRIENSANISKLVKRWCWTRITVTKFIGQLQKLNIVKTESLNSEIRISLNPDVLQWTNSSKEHLEGCQDPSVPSQPPLQHISSGETEEYVSK